MTRLVLTNAIYFKGDWHEKFKKEDTKPAPFMLADGKKADVPLMFRAGTYHYTETDGYQILDLPYVGKRLSMTVILPKRPDGLPAIEKVLTGEKLAAVLKGLQPEHRIHVHLPKFKVEKDFTLNKPLQALGMKTAFDVNKADFGGMHTGREALHISKVLHKVFVDVNEEGTEAAAATAVVTGEPGVREPKVFRADRPFLYLIRDHKTASVLFMGRLSEPTK
jgi:serpin B